MQNIIKKYVRVTAVFSPDGKMKPLWITWEDGRKFTVDRVTDCRRCASTKAGGSGMRFTCMIAGGEHFLYYEENYKWFVEARSS